MSKLKVVLLDFRYLEPKVRVDDKADKQLNNNQDFQVSRIRIQGCVWIHMGSLGYKHS
jgi:hypothetical protein